MTHDFWRPVNWYLWWSRLLFWLRLGKSDDSVCVLVLLVVFRLLLKMTYLSLSIYWYSRVCVGFLLSVSVVLCDTTGILHLGFLNLSRDTKCPNDSLDTFWKRTDVKQDSIRDFWSRSGLSSAQEMYEDLTVNRCCVCVRTFKRPQDLKTHCTRERHHFDNLQSSVSTKAVQEEKW